jgi:hypothetical protein
MHKRELRHTLVVASAELPSRAFKACRIQRTSDAMLHKWCHSGGYSHYMRTIREVKMDAVNAALLELSTPEPEAVVDTTDQMARFKRLRKLSGD